MLELPLTPLPSHRLPRLLRRRAQGRARRRCRVDAQARGRAQAVRRLRAADEGVYPGVQGVVMACQA